MQPRPNRGSRALVLGAFAAGIAGALAAVFSALGAPSSTDAAEAASPAKVARTVRFGDARVVASSRPSGGACFRVMRGSSTLAHSCVGHVHRSEIGFAATPTAVGGLAGDQVAAVIVRVRGRGTVWAQLREGAFLAALPPRRPARAVVKVLRGGARTTFPVRQSR